MKKCAVLIVVLFASAVFAQTGCEFTIAGDWETTTQGKAESFLYRFGSDGTVTVFSTQRKTANVQKIGKATYRLLDAKPSRILEFRLVPGGGTFPLGPARMEITHFDRVGFTAVNTGQSTSWVRKDPNRYFVVLAAHRGTPPHHGGPAFAVLVKSGEKETQAETFGLFYRNEERAVGMIPDELYEQFNKEPVSPEDALLRVRVSPQAFDAAMKVMRDWQQRAKEGSLLFPGYSYLNVIVPLKQIAESLEQCSDDFHAYKLTWMLDDEMGANVPQWELAYQYVKKLRELNQQNHLSDVKFQQSITSRLTLPLSNN